MKTRHDFVSNSSSSSYIIAAEAGCTAEDVAEDVAKNVFGDDSSEVKQFFETKTALTAACIEYVRWNEDLGMMEQNSIPVGVCVDDSELCKFFGEDGEVKSSLDPAEVVESLSWSRPNGDENEDVVYERRLMGKVTDKTLKFTKWLYSKAAELYGGCNCVLNTGYNLDAYADRLANGCKLYLMRFSYDGDAMCYGHVYISDTGGWKRSIGTMISEDSRHVKDTWFVDG